MEARMSERWVLERSDLADVPQTTEDCLASYQLSFSLSGPLERQSVGWKCHLQNHILMVFGNRAFSLYVGLAEVLQSGISRCHSGFIRG